MKKPNLACLASLLVCLILTACSGTEPPVVTTDETTPKVTETEAPIVLPTAKEIAESMASKCTFSEELTSNDAYLSHHLFDFASLSASFTDSAALIPLGITPEEVLVFIAKDEKGAETLCDKLKAYIEYQRSEYGSYKPSEVPKLDDAVVASEGVVVIYTVSLDYAAAVDAAKAMLNQFK